MIASVDIHSRMYAAVTDWLGRQHKLGNWYCPHGYIVCCIRRCIHGDNTNLLNVEQKRLEKYCHSRSSSIAGAYLNVCNLVQCENRLLYNMEYEEIHKQQKYFPVCDSGTYDIAVSVGKYSFCSNFLLHTTYLYNPLVRFIRIINSNVHDLGQTPVTDISSLRL